MIGYPARDRSSATMIPVPSSELFSVQRRLKSRLLSWSESYRCLLPKLDRSLKRAKARRDFHSGEALEDLFPLTIDHDLELKLLERTQAPKLFKLVDSNRAHLRQWLPFVDDYRSVNAANQFISEKSRKPCRKNPSPDGDMVGRITSRRRNLRLYRLGQPSCIDRFLAGQILRGKRDHDKNV